MARTRISHLPDEQYKEATKAVIDDAMRTDILGPNFLRVIRDYKPVNDVLREIMAESITETVGVHTALTTFIDEYDLRRKGRWLERIIWLIAGALVTGIISVLISKYL
ncbi:hypothetical protein KGQ71_03330 [Patescibacteria group bacterium]|nr:hypothetical protein [Patescibacteria group bacterium]